MKWIDFKIPPTDDKEKNIRYLIGKEWVRDTAYYEGGVWMDSKSDKPFPPSFYLGLFEWLDESTPEGQEANSLAGKTVYIPTRRITNQCLCIKGQEELGTYLEQIVLPSSSLYSPSVDLREGRSKEEIIHMGINFAKTLNADNESYLSGAGFGYSCGYEAAMDGYRNQPTQSIAGISDWLSDFFNWIKEQEEISLRLNDAGGLVMLRFVKEKIENLTTTK